MSKFLGRIYSNVELSQDSLGELDSLCNKAVLRRDTLGAQDFYSDVFHLPNGGVLSVTLGAHVQFATYDEPPPVGAQPQITPRITEEEPEEVFKGVYLTSNGRLFVYQAGTWETQEITVGLRIQGNEWRGFYESGEPTLVIACAATNSRVGTWFDFAGDRTPLPTFEPYVYARGVKLPGPAPAPFLGVAAAVSGGTRYIVGITAGADAYERKLYARLFSDVASEDWIDCGTFSIGAEVPGVRHAMPFRNIYFAPDGLEASEILEFNDSTATLSQQSQYIERATYTVSPTGAPSLPFTFSGFVGTATNSVHSYGSGTYSTTHVPFPETQPTPYYSTNSTFTDNHDGEVLLAFEYDAAGVGTAVTATQAWQETDVRARTPDEPNKQIRTTRTVTGSVTTTIGDVTLTGSYTESYDTLQDNNNSTFTTTVHTSEDSREVYRVIDIDPRFGLVAIIELRRTKQGDAVDVTDPITAPTQTMTTYIVDTYTVRIYINGVEQYSEVVRDVPLDLVSGIPHQAGQWAEEPSYDNTNTRWHTFVTARGNVRGGTNYPEIYYTGNDTSARSSFWTIDLTGQAILGSFEYGPFSNENPNYYVHFATDADIATLTGYATTSLPRVIGILESTDSAIFGQV